MFVQQLILIVRSILLNDSVDVKLRGISIDLFCAILLGVSSLSVIAVSNFNVIRLQEYYLCFVDKPNSA